MASAIRDNNPVLFIEHKQLLGVSGDVPEDEYLVPLGKASIMRQGTDVTIVAWSWMAQKALAAAEILAQDGISAEVLDPRTLVPLDKASILHSLGKTNKLVIVHEAVKTGGYAGEIAAIVADEGFDLLDSPIKRVTAPDTPVPFSPTLEAAYVPSVDSIVQTVKSLF